MANYIKKEILSEAYTHLDIKLFNDKEKLETLRKDLTSFFKERASFIFETEVDILIEFEDGSLKTRVIAIGSAAAVIANVVSAYPSFKEGVTQLANDAAVIAQSANFEVIFRTKTPYCDRLRVEKRKGVFGRVQALLIELESIATDIENSKLPSGKKAIAATDNIIDSLLQWDEKVDVLFEKFEDSNTEACIAEGLKKEFDQLPSDFPWQKEITQSNLKSQIVDSDPQASIAITGLSTRYKATKFALQKKLIQRYKQATEE